MSLIKWSPFRELEDVDRFFDLSPYWGRMMRHIPAANISEDRDHIFVEVALPGFKGDHISVSVENDILTVDAKVEKKTEVDEKNYSLKEFSAESVHRSFQLPSAVVGDKATASYKEDGMLRVTVPKREEVKPKAVKVQVE